MLSFFGRFSLRGFVICVNTGRSPQRYRAGEASGADERRVQVIEEVVSSALLFRGTCAQRVKNVATGAREASNRSGVYSESSPRRLFAVNPLLQLAGHSPATFFIPWTAASPPGVTYSRD